MRTKFSDEKLSALNLSMRYDPETGSFFKRVRDLDVLIAGAVNDGYRIIRLLGIPYRAHILAWWVMTGSSVPSGYEIDHINRDRGDNRWMNLRIVKRSRNNHNSNPHRNNTSGVKGVSWVKRDNKWDARIKIGGKVILLGRHEKFEDAVAARMVAEQSHLGESPTARTGVPSAPATAPIIQKRTRWIDENRGEFRENRSLTVKRTNTSGCPGVRLHKQSGLWHARITVSGKELSLGYFKEFQGAVTARLAAEMAHFGRTHKDP